MADYLAHDIIKLHCEAFVSRGRVFISKMPLLGFLVIFFATASATDMTRPEIERKILQDIYLQSKFHSYVRPYESYNEPARVNINLHVLHLDLDEENEEMDITIYFRQEWNDSRLAYDDQGKLKSIVLHDVIGFWTPDLFFVDENNAHLHTITKQNNFARIYPDGRVLYSQKLTLESLCPLNLKRYPFDSQTCHLQIESYGYTADDLVLKWKRGNESPVTGRFRLAGYDATFAYREQISVANAEYTAAILEIQFKRHWTIFLLQIYIPISLFVAGSWVTFWLSPKSQFIRLTLSLAMAISSLFQVQINDDLFLTPGYPTGMDVWTAFSSTLLFVAFFVNVYITYVNRESREEEKTKTGHKSMASLVLKVSAKLDVISRVLFPCFFALFHVVYAI